MKVPMKAAISMALVAALLLPAGRIVASPDNIVASIRPLHSLISGVVAGTGEVALLLQDSTSPHNINLKPSQLQLLQQADIVFYIDDGFETFLPSVFAAMPQHLLKLPVAKHAGLEILPMRHGSVWQQHQHGQHDGHKLAVADGRQDMHLWLDPRNAQKIATYVATELSAIYPENRGSYVANAAALIARIEALHSATMAKLSPYDGQAFVVMHDAFQYFERSYGLTGVGAITITPDQHPSAQRIIDVRKIIRQSEVQCIFAEPQSTERLLATIVEGTGAKIANLDPLGTSIEAGKELYFKLLNDMAVNIVQCLQ